MVFADLPRQGLCNRIHVWARAFVFSELNGLPLYTHGWGKIRVGPFVRREKSKRIYASFFKCKSNIFQFYLLSFFKKKQITREPVLKKIEHKKPGSIFIFHNYPRIDIHDIFEDILPYRQQIKKAFFQIINPRYSSMIAGLEKPAIAVHIRRGDFKILGIAKDDHFFIEKINKLRAKIGSNTRVHVFSDATAEEIKEVLALGNTVLVDNKNDLLDLIQLSFSSHLILSPDSTFSLWAAFLSEGKVMD